ncbi:HEAT repeat domain-containing protein [Candidatus Protofrankia californiensis]|uniref:HEAT repeat domain-containing protein n=1 Tax=Candidatus Protofrankia californiensis TaxID=1839754 RepID=UPI001041B67E|nr:HEAT repeat domain-containing protein [Candidatus Protofrankia californiensis]
MIETPDEFVRLRRSEDREEYSRAAEEEAPMPVWLEIVKNHPDMRFWVAHNKKVPMEVLRILARDEDDRVRGMVARKRKISDDILEILAVDPEESVRNAVALNPRTPRALLEILTKDPWQVVRENARRRIGEAPTGR